MWGVAIGKLKVEDGEFPAVIKGHFPSLVIPVSLPGYLYPIWKALDEVELKEFPWMVYASLGVTGRGNWKLIWEDREGDTKKAIIIATLKRKGVIGLEIIKDVVDSDFLYHFLGIAEKDKNFILDFGVVNRVYRYDGKDLKEVMCYVSKR